MRLDHLLSKEHLAGWSGAEPLRSHTSTGGQLMGGTLTLALGGSSPAQYRCFGSAEGCGSGYRVRARCWVLRDQAAPFGVSELLNRTGWPALQASGRRDRPYVENYTVDASILDPGFGSGQMIFIDHWSAAFGLPINQQYSCMWSNF